MFTYTRVHQRVALHVDYKDVCCKDVVDDTCICCIYID